MIGVILIYVRNTTCHLYSDFLCALSRVTFIRPFCAQCHVIFILPLCMQYRVSPSFLFSVCNTCVTFILPPFSLHLTVLVLPFFFQDL
jgi:hypothetical protein